MRVFRDTVSGIAGSHYLNRIIVYFINLVEHKLNIPNDPKKH